MQINKKVKSKTLTLSILAVNQMKIVIIKTILDIKTSSGIEKLTNLTVLTEFTVDGQICYCS